MNKVEIFYINSYQYLVEELLNYHNIKYEINLENVWCQKVKISKKDFNYLRLVNDKKLLLIIKNRDGYINFTKAIYYGCQEI